MQTTQTSEMSKPLQYPTDTSDVQPQVDVLPSLDTPEGLLAAGDEAAARGEQELNTLLTLREKVKYLQPDTPEERDATSERDKFEDKLRQRCGLDEGPVYKQPYAYNEFLNSLTPEQQQLYEQARQERSKREARERHIAELAEAGVDTAHLTDEEINDGIATLHLRDNLGGEVARIQDEMGSLQERLRSRQAEIADLNEQLRSLGNPEPTQEPPAI